MKDRLLADLDARISRHANGDSAGVVDEVALAVVSELAALGDPDAGSLARVAALHLCRYEALPPEHGEVDLRLARAIYTNLHTVDPRLVPPDVRNFLGLASPRDTGIALMREYERTGRIDLLERAISLLRQEVLEHLGRDAGATDRSDVDEAVAIGREVVSATIGDPNHAMDLSHLAMALARRFERTGQRADLDEAVAAAREAVTITPTNHPSRAAHLDNLGRLLRLRFERGGRR